MQAGAASNNAPQATGTQIPNLISMIRSSYLSLSLQIHSNAARLVYAPHS
jgi:hypothetical protein